MKIFNWFFEKLSEHISEKHSKWFFEKLSQKLSEHISEKHSKWFFEKVGDVLIVQVPMKDISPSNIKKYLDYVKKGFEQHLESLGVKEIIVVANRE